MACLLSIFLTAVSAFGQIGQIAADDIGTAAASIAPHGEECTTISLLQAGLQLGKLRNLAGGRVSDAWLMQGRRSLLPHVSVAQHKSTDDIRKMFEAAQADLQRRHAAGFAGFKGTGSTFQVRYSIKPAGNKGLGAFAEEAIHKGQSVYGHWTKPEVRHMLHVIPTGMLNTAESVAATFSKDVVGQLLQWCEDNWLTDETGIVCEMDDEHFINHDSNPNLVYCGANKGMCASRDIAAGEELVEDYRDEELDTKQSEMFAAKIQKAALASH